MTFEGSREITESSQTRAFGPSQPSFELRSLGAGQSILQILTQSHRASQGRISRHELRSTLLLLAVARPRIAPQSPQPTAQIGALRTSSKAWPAIFIIWKASKTTRVPLVIKVPGQPARRITAPAGLIDIYPTLCELAGLPVPDGLDGLSLTGLIEGRPGAEQRPPALTSHGPGNFSLRDERWRYTRYTDGSEEFYDHTNDPEERRNLATNAEYKDAIARLKPFVPEESKPFAPGSKGMGSPQFPGK
jgi:hypothetical protein